MEQLVLWQPEFTVRDNETVLTCFISSALALQPSFETGELTKEIFRVLYIPGDIPFTVSWKRYRSIYTVYPDDYYDINEAWASVWLITIVIKGTGKYRTTEEENCFLDSGGVYNEETANEADELILIMDFETEEEFNICYDKIQEVLKTTIVLKRDIRNKQLHQAFFVPADKNIKNNDWKKIFKQVLDLVVENNGFYNHVLRTDVLGEMNIPGGIPDQK